MAGGCGSSSWARQQLHGSVVVLHVAQAGQPQGSWCKELKGGRVEVPGLASWWWQLPLMSALLAACFVLGNGQGRKQEVDPPLGLIDGSW